jgi:hypothetical protein
MRRYVDGAAPCRQQNSLPGLDRLADDDFDDDDYPSLRPVNELLTKWGHPTVDKASLIAAYDDYAHERVLFDVFDDLDPGDFDDDEYPHLRPVNELSKKGGHPTIDKATMVAAYDDYVHVRARCRASFQGRSSGRGGNTDAGA